MTTFQTPAVIGIFVGVGSSVYRMSYGSGRVSRTL